MKNLNSQSKISIIGMGYVGLPLSILIAKKSFNVFGFDQDYQKIKKLLHILPKLLFVLKCLKAKEFGLLFG